MELRYVKRVAETAGVSLEGVRLKILRDIYLVNIPFAGYTNLENGGTIELYPLAFTNRETLVRTLAHERMHIYQLRIFGEPLNSVTALEYELAAKQAEEDAWAYYIYLNGGE